MNTQRQEKMVLHAKVGVAGKYRLRVGKRGQEPRIDTGWFDNIITDAGLNFAGGNSGWLNACQVGSGTTAPTAGDTSLVSFVAGTSATESDTGTAEATAPYYTSRTKTFRFAEGDAAGNLSEVGIGNAATAGTLFSRALITDGSGTATTITVLADEFLDVTYQLQLVPPTSDTTFNVTDSGPDGTVHAVTLRASMVTSNPNNNVSWRADGAQPTLLQGAAFDGAIGDVTQAPSGSTSGGAKTTDAYVNNSLERTGSIAFGLNAGNFGAGLKSLQFGFPLGGVWQAEFDPVIPKTSTKTLNFDVKVSWTRTTAL